MGLVVAGTFGSLPEATVVFSSLSSAGFNPFAEFNMNTPGVAGGMAPSSYRVMVPEAEGEAARQFISELVNNPFSVGESELEDNEDDDLPTGGVLSGLRPIVRLLVVGLLVGWIAITLLRCSLG